MEALLVYGSSSESDSDSKIHEGHPPKRLRKNANTGCNIEQGGTFNVPSSAKVDSTDAKQSGNRVTTSSKQPSIHSLILPNSYNVGLPTSSPLALPRALYPGRRFEIPELHQGRLRNFPHVEGNYATHVYIPVKVPASYNSTLAQALDRAKQMFPALQPLEDPKKEQDHQAHQQGGLKQADCYHISLSRTVPIKHHQIDTLMEMLKENFLGQKRYMVKLSEWQAFVNDEHTRSFLALGTSQGTQEICRQVTLVNEAFAVHELPAFYEAPRPHISVAWCHGKRLADLEVLSNELASSDSSSKDTTSSTRLDHQEWIFEVERVECKVGKKIFVIWAG